jgi:CDP-glucose 4,6-dehydratase
MRLPDVTVARPDPAFWAGRRVLVTGHTGFKGSWLCLLLHHLGAQVSGLALPAEPDGAFTAMRPPVESTIVDIRDAAAVADTVRQVRPDIVLHLAAQALVNIGHERPLETFATNVMGTANILQALHSTPAAVALVITSDKVYRDPGNGAVLDEESPLGGLDPYSASKAAAEHVAACWRERLRPSGCQVATARAGNVFGGGDSSVGRLVPDVIRAHHSGVQLVLRRPASVRPWQYVLDVLSGYLIYAQALFNGKAPPALNFGPDPSTAITAAALAERLQQALGAPAGWRHEGATFDEVAELRLDPRLAMQTLGWRTTTDVERAVISTAAWHQSARRGEDMRGVGVALIEAHSQSL